MERVDGVRANLIKNLFEASVAEHSDAQQNFATLDTKAQNTAAIAGVFLAGALALFGGDSVQKIIKAGGSIEISLIGAVAILLMFSIVSCLLAMRIREIAVRDIAILREDVETILDMPHDELNERYENHLLTQVAEWDEVSKNLRNANKGKSFYTYWGQLSLGLATLVVAGLLLFTAYTVQNLPMEPNEKEQSQSSL